MFFPECDTIAQDCAELRAVVEQIDAELQEVLSESPLRPGDFASLLDAEEDHVKSVFRMLAKRGLLRACEMLECEECSTLIPLAAWRRASVDEIPLECTGCGAIVSAVAPRITVYEMTRKSLKRTQSAQMSRNDHLPDQSVVKTPEQVLSTPEKLFLRALLDYGAFDPDRLISTEKIVENTKIAKDANSLKRAGASLSRRGLTQAQSGPGGGYWLTENGKRRAENLSANHAKSVASISNQLDTHSTLSNSLGTATLR
jgi:hypothetical protein